MTRSRRQGTAYAEVVHEDAFMAQVLQYATLLRWELRYHTHDSRRSDRGFPDLVLLRPPRLVFVELKRRRGQPTPEQCEWLEALAQAGQAAYLWRPDDWPEIERVLA